MDFFLSFILLSLCFAASWFLIQALYGRTRLRLPPGPKPFPLVGNLFELGEKPHVSLTKLSQRYGPLISLQLGQVTTVVASSSAMAKEILRNHDQFFCNRTVPDALLAFADYSLPWLPVSPRWRNLRKLCNLQLFATKVLDANQDSRRFKLQELIASVNDCMVKGVAVDIGEAAFKTTLNLLSRTCFSMDLADTGSGSNETAREFKEIVWGIMEEAGKPNLGDFFPVLRKIDPQGIRRRFHSYYIKMLGFIGSMINQRTDSRKGNDYVTHNDMLDTIMNISQENNEEDMKDPQVVEHLFLVSLYCFPMFLVA